jgi:hypothetical protein
VQIGSATNWARISAGYDHTIAIKTDGTLWAWGSNGDGQLGDGTYVDKNSPVQIGTATNWASISAGFKHSIAIKTDGSLWAWGLNNNGKLGDGTTAGKNSPVQISSCVTCTPTTGTFNIAACNSYTWAAKGNKVYTASNNTDTIHLTNAGGCDSLVTLNLTIVNSLPAIGGANAVCVGSTTTLSNTLSGGVWSSISGRASVNVSGEVTGTSGGTATIKYAKAGCGSVTKTVTVNALPATPTIGIVPGTPGITGSGGYCKNKTFSVVGKPTGGTWSSTGAFAITNLGVVTTDATPGAGSVSYAYTNSNGCTSSRTIPANVVTCSSKGINNQMAVSNEQLVVYPNPAHSSINLNIKTLVGKGSIVVTDLYGKTVKTQALSMGTNTIDIAKLSKGMYFVSTITNEGKTTKKLIVE